MSGELAGLAAVGLWVLTGAAVQARLTDGRISRPDLIRIVLNPALADQLARSLVSAKLWHGRGHDCPRCPQPVCGDYEGDWIFHDWKDLGYDSATQVKTTRAKRRELKDPALINAVWQRDCTAPQKPGTGRCRYCGVEVHRQTRVGDLTPTLDHVDPSLAIGIRNVVLACKLCNSKKGNRTPAQAGLTLLPAPAHSPASTSDRPAPGPDPGPNLVDQWSSTGWSEHGPNLVDQWSKVSRADDARAYGPGMGMGSGLGEGPGEGDRPGSGDRSAPASKAARRRRRRKGPAVSTPAGETGLDAGDFPVPEGPGRFGSPWHGWRGPPSPVTETTCPDHGLPQPCWKCLGATDA